MRAALDKWMKDCGDLGGVPEDELIQRFWPGHSQPVTATPVMTVAADRTLGISCATPGASIGYRIGDEAHWHVYTAPFPVPDGATVGAKAIRLGYKASAEVVR